MYQELHINTQRLSHHDWFWRLRPFAHQLFRLPGFRWIRPLAAQAAAVAAPAAAAPAAAAGGDAPAKEEKKEEPEEEEGPSEEEAMAGLGALFG